MIVPTRRWSCNKAITLLIIVFFLVKFPHLQASSDANSSFTLALKNADIRSLIETVSRATGRNFIVDPRVQAKVTVVASEPVAADRLYELFLSVLQVHGFATVPAGNFTKIVPAATGVQSGVPVVGGERRLAADAADELVSRVIRIEGKPVQPLVAALTPLLPPDAKISAEANSNSLIITDRAANIEKIIEIVQTLVGAN